MVCKSCGNNQDDDFEFCVNCGKKLTGSVTCGGCGAVLPPESLFCGKCGKKIGSASVSGPAGKKVPFYGSRKVKKVSHLTATWIFAAVFLIMLGLSFGAFIKIDMTVSTGYGYETISVKASPVDVLIATFSPKKSESEISAELTSRYGNPQSASAIEKALSEYGILKVAFSRENLNAMPFSGWASLALYSLIALSMLVLSGVFFGISLARAIKAVGKDPDDYKPIKAGRFFAATGALSLAAVIFLGEGTTQVEGLRASVSAGYGVISMLCLSLASLAALFIFNMVLCGKRFGSYKKLIAGSVNAAIALALVFSVGANAVNIKIKEDYEYPGISIHFEESAGYDAASGAAAIDNAMNFNKPGNLFLLDIDYVVERVVYMLQYSRGTDAEIYISALHPAQAAFYNNFGTGERGGMVAVGAVSFVSYLAGMALAALMFAVNISDIADVGGDKKKRRVYPFVFLITATALMLAASIATAVLGTSLYNAVSSYFNAKISIGIGFFMAANFVLVIGAAVQNRILWRKADKKPGEQPAQAAVYIQQ